MNKTRTLLKVALISSCLLWTGCKKANNNGTSTENNITESITATVTAIPTVTITPTATPAITEPVTPTGMSEEALNQAIDNIQKENPQYQNCEMLKYQFGNAYAVVFVPPDAKKEFFEYFCDLWVVSNEISEKVLDQLYIDYDSLSTGEIDGAPFMRYDLTYATESVTNLLMLDDQGQLHKISLRGCLDSIDGKNLTIVESRYDMMYQYGDGISCGHTWKPYYYYLEDFELKEYPITEMEQEEFLSYQGAQEILELITDEYANPDTKVTFRFLSQENGKIYLNTRVETSSEYTYYFKTYETNSSKELSLIDSGEGTYAGFLQDEVKKVQLTEYREPDRIIVYPMELLYNSNEQDKIRIHELIEAGKLEDSKDKQKQGVYLYIDENQLAYQLADDVSIELRDETMEPNLEGEKNLLQCYVGGFLQITIENDVVTKIQELSVE